jgi:hypothetical protein
VFVQYRHPGRQGQSVGYVKIADAKAVDRELTDLERFESCPADNEAPDS